MKRFCALLISLLFVLALVPFGAFDISAEETDSQGLTYTLTNDKSGYIVSGYSSDRSSLVIPSEFNGKPVKEIGGRALFK